MDKRAWRERARADRTATALDHDGHLTHLRPFLEREVASGRWIVTYDPLDDEIDLGPLHAAHPESERRFALTRTPDEGLTLTVHPVGGPVEVHPYGYLQPAVDAPTVPDERIGAVLVPGLLFAADGGRLGRGKGYYDRFLSRLGPATLLIGITGDHVVDRVPVDDHDVAMTHLSTGTGVWPVPVELNG